ncbi:hypothetical protein KKD61_05100, partial [Patescibacteria group bacterium]|nr:hypothetical protein [Patescibacteria group bacterium]
MNGEGQDDEVKDLSRRRFVKLAIGALAGAAAAAAGAKVAGASPDSPSPSPTPDPGENAKKVPSSTPDSSGQPGSVGEGVNVPPPLGDGTPPPGSPGDNSAGSEGSAEIEASAETIPGTVKEIRNDGQDLSVGCVDLDGRLYSFGLNIANVGTTLNLAAENPDTGEFDQPVTIEGFPLISRKCPFASLVRLPNDPDGKVLILANVETGTAQGRVEAWIINSQTGEKQLVDGHDVDIPKHGMVAMVVEAGNVYYAVKGSETGHSADIFRLQPDGAGGYASVLEEYLAKGGPNITGLARKNGRWVVASQGDDSNSVAIASFKPGDNHATETKISYLNGMKPWSCPDINGHHPAGVMIAGVNEAGYPFMALYDPGTNVISKMTTRPDIL